MKQLPKPAKPKRLLVIEDDPKTQQLLKSYLRLSPVPLEVTVVDDGVAALELLARQPVDLICLDLLLPHISGFEVCERLRKTLKLKTPVLVLSCRSSPEDRAHAEELGASRYLIKPIKAKPFLAEVHRLLQTPVAAGGRS